MHFFRDVFFGQLWKELSRFCHTSSIALSKSRSYHRIAIEEERFLSGGRRSFGYSKRKGVLLVKARWLSFRRPHVLDALLGISTAGRRSRPHRRRPKGPPREPPVSRGPEGRARSRSPTTRRTGYTVLGVDRLPATASDTSASVAARLGKTAPDRGESRGGYRVGRRRQARRPRGPDRVGAAATRTTSAVKRLSQRADCCSSSGCDAVEVTRDVEGALGFLVDDWIGTFHHRVYWCWSYPRITGVNVNCWSNVDGSVHQRRRLRRLG